MKIQLIEDFNGFLRLHDEWNRLWKHSKNPSVFLSHDWIRCCWEELQSANILKIFVVYRGNEPVMIAPLMSSRARQNKFPVKRLSFIEHPEAQVADVICDEGPEAEQGFQQLMAHLFAQSRRQWQLLSLNKIPSCSPLVRWIEGGRRASLHAGWHGSRSSVLVVPLAGSWDEFLRAKSSRFRKTLRNIVNRVERMGETRIECYGATRPAQAALPKLFSIADASWKLASGVAVTSSSARKRFFEQLLEDPATAQHMRIWFLEVNDTPVASEIQVVDGETVYALRSDYDEKFAESSPGVYLQAEILKRLFGSQYRYYSFGVGLNPYKARWTERSADFLNYRIYNQTLYGRVLDWVDRRAAGSRPAPTSGLCGAAYAEKA
jgi:CelD/BcsL family acetyltransferase involved in cellulose biosynthesis